MFCTLSSYSWSIFISLFVTSSFSFVSTSCTASVCIYCRVFSCVLGERKHTRTRWDINISRAIRSLRRESTLHLFSFTRLCQWMNGYVCERGRNKRIDFECQSRQQQLPRSYHSSLQSFSFSLTFIRIEHTRSSSEKKSLFHFDFCHTFSHPDFVLRLSYITEQTYRVYCVCVCVVIAIPFKTDPVRQWLISASITIDTRLG